MSASYNYALKCGSSMAMVFMLPYKILIKTEMSCCMTYCIRFSSNFNCAASCSGIYSTALSKPSCTGYRTERLVSQTCSMLFVCVQAVPSPLVEVLPLPGGAPKKD